MNMYGVFLVIQKDRRHPYLLLLVVVAVIALFAPIDVLNYALADSSGVNEVKILNKTHDLIKASGASGLIEHIDKCQKGNSQSCFVLGIAFMFSHGVKKDATIGIYWETKAAELGYSDAQYNLSIEYFEGLSVEKNVDKGIYWERLAAENGHRVAMYNLGIGACEGIRKDMACKDGIKYLQRASQKGFV